MGERCTGQCCKAFYLLWSPEEIARAVIKRDDPEQAQIAAMVIYRPELSDPERHSYVYGCNNLLPSGNCGVYETRPAMCRNYPYENPCPQVDLCEWDEGRLGRAGYKRHLPLCPSTANARVESDSVKDAAGSHIFEQLRNVRAAQQEAEELRADEARQNAEE